MSEFDHIIIYLKVVESKSFTAAADKLGISPNAVSKHVTQLEEELGLTLFSRSTRRLQVTEAGKMIYEKGKIAQRSLEDINEYARSSQVEPEGVLSIISSMGVGQYLIAEYLPEFLSLYPKLRLNLQFSDDFPDLDEFDHNSIDLIYGFPSSLTPEKIVNGDFVRKPVNRIQRIVCASPGYLARHGEPKSYEDLANHCIIIHTHNQSQKNLLLAECEKRNIVLPKILIVNNSASIIRLMRSGSGIAPIADFIVANEIATGAIHRILPIHQEPKIETFLFYKKTRYLPLKISCFIDFFSKKIA